MFLLSDLFRDYLIVFLEASFVALGVLFAYVLVRHAVASWREQRDARLRALYQPDVDAVLAATGPDNLESAIARLASAPPRHVPQIGALLIKPLRVASGSPVDSARAAATRLGLVERWKKDLGAHAWWRQAEAARALGLVRAEGALRPLLALPRRRARRGARGRRRGARPPRRSGLRAGAAAGAARRLAPPARPRRRGDPRAGAGRGARAHRARPRPPRRSGDGRRADRLHRRGERRRRPAGVVEPRRRPGAGRGAAGAGLARARRPRLLLRAARARRRDATRCGRWPRARWGDRAARDAAPYLAQHLGDEWLVAAHAATALRMLGPAG